MLKKFHSDQALFRVFNSFVLIEVKLK